MAAYGAFHHTSAVRFSQFRADHFIRNTPLKVEYQTRESEEPERPQVWNSVWQPTLSTLSQLYITAFTSHLLCFRVIKKSNQQYCATSTCTYIVSGRHAQTVYCVMCCYMLVFTEFITTIDASILQSTNGTIWHHLLLQSQTFQGKWNAPWV